MGYRCFFTKHLLSDDMMRPKSICTLVYTAIPLLSIFIEVSSCLNSYFRLSRINENDKININAFGFTMYVFYASRMMLLFPAKWRPLGVAPTHLNCGILLHRGRIVQEIVVGVKVYTNVYLQRMGTL